MTSQNIKILLENLTHCNLCPIKCGANRKKQKGVCGAGAEIKIASHNVHFGEEPAISGQKGSGTIFFSYCSLHCKFCQNYPISQLGNGVEISVEKLAQIMLDLQAKQVHNINLVSPTHFFAQIAQGVYLAKTQGLKIPIIYNGGGYENVETLKLLEGSIDIYMPDCKYALDELAYKYSGIKNYCAHNKNALLEMQRQVGQLVLDKNSIAKKGLLIRHLVLPQNLQNSKKVLEFIAKTLSTKTFISIMSQYHPAYKAYEFEELSHKLTLSAYQQVLDYMDELGFENGWRQEV
ncbi:MAG: radical SAM protein [Elusimicrobiota bacterium]|jgi:putative pyruvate formate lyase activating enzyme|nr:radical SAM protein [Elusimicrobiota bacterium]